MIFGPVFGVNHGVPAGKCTSVIVDTSVKDAKDAIVFTLVLNCFANTRHSRQIRVEGSAVVRIDMHENYVAE